GNIGPGGELADELMPGGQTLSFARDAWNGIALHDRPVNIGGGKRRSRLKRGSGEGGRLGRCPGLVRPGIRERLGFRADPVLSLAAADGPRIALRLKSVFGFTPARTNGRYIGHAVQKIGGAGGALGGSHQILRIDRRRRLANAGPDILRISRLVRRETRGYRGR